MTADGDNDWLDEDDWNAMELDLLRRRAALHAARAVRIQADLDRFAMALADRKACGCPIFAPGEVDAEDVGRSLVRHGCGRSAGRELVRGLALLRLWPEVGR